MPFTWTPVIRMGEYGKCDRTDLIVGGKTYEVIRRQDMYTGVSYYAEDCEEDASVTLYREDTTQEDATMAALAAALRCIRVHPNQA